MCTIVLAIRSTKCGYLDHHNVPTTFSAFHGEVTGLAGLTGNAAGRIYCKWSIAVPETYNTFLEIELLPASCKHRPRLHVGFKWSPPFGSSVSFICPFIHTAPLVVRSNTAHLELFVNSRHPLVLVEFRVRFRAIKGKCQSELNMVMTSAASGYITSPGYNGRDFYPPMTFSVRTIVLNSYHSVMLSFEEFKLQVRGNVGTCIDWIMLFASDATENGVIMWKVCGREYIAPEVYNQSIEVYFSSDKTKSYTGFKMRFSFFRSTHSHLKLTSGLFNCSVSYYTQFKDHVDCNMKQECEDREDERGHCPFSSPACDGSVAVGDKCYSLVKGVATSVLEINLECTKRNFTTGMMKTTEEWKAISVFLDFNCNFVGGPSIFIGLVIFNKDVPDYYRKIYNIWTDGTVDYITDRREGMTAVMYADGAQSVCTAYGTDYRLRYTTCIVYSKSIYSL